MASRVATDSDGLVNEALAEGEALGLELLVDATGALHATTDSRLTAARAVPKTVRLSIGIELEAE